MLHSRSIALIASLVSLLLTALPTTARAQGTGGGLIYFTLGGNPYTMNSDGTGKTAQPLLASGEPSRALHASLRWFLQVREIPGEFYPDSTPRREVFAVRADANEAFTVRLTDQPDLQVFITARGHVRWSPGDAQVSWVAARWIAGTLTDAGVYASTVLFDGAGNIAGLAAQPASPLIICTVVNDQGPRPSIRSHDWSPTGAQMVLHATPSGTNQLFIATFATAQTVLVPTSVPVMLPSWSPAGTKIVFQHAVLGGGISTINTNGSGQQAIVPAGRRGAHIQDPIWSPTGSHIIYNNAGSVLNDERQDVYRATSTGSSKTNLTAAINTRSSSGTPARVTGWR